MVVVKVQLPIYSSDPDAPALIYPEDRSGMAMQALDDATRIAMGDDVKAFFNAELDSDGERWKIGARVSWQNW